MNDSESPISAMEIPCILNDWQHLKQHFDAVTRLAEKAKQRLEARQQPHTSRASTLAIATGLVAGPGDTASLLADPIGRTLLFLASRVMSDSDFRFGIFVNLLCVACWFLYQATGIVGR